MTSSFAAEAAIRVKSTHLIISVGARSGDAVALGPRARV